MPLSLFVLEKDSSLVAWPRTLPYQPDTAGDVLANITDYSLPKPAIHSLSDNYARNGQLKSFSGRTLLKHGVRTDCKV
jgi:hypothetical protein